jgi:protein TonB
MVQTTFRHAQSGQLAERPSPARITAFSGVIALHAAAFLLLLMPTTAPEPVAKDSEPTPIIFIRDKIIPVVPPPPEEIRRPTRVTTRAVPAPTPPAPVLVEDSPVAEPYIESPPIAEEISVVPPIPDTTPLQGARLEYASAPPPTYPVAEARRRIEGEVLLQVLVGVDGKPIEVTVQRSSGNRALDEAARKQVLRAWTFKPAMRDGVVVQAVGLVPVKFTLR